MQKMKIAGVAALVALGVSAGGAYTAGNTLNGNNVAGYGTSTVSGATTEVIEHTLSTDGSKITSTNLTFTTDLTTDHAVKAGFGTTAVEDCVLTQGTAGAKDTAVCTYAAGGYTVSDATSFKVTVS